MGQGQSWPWDLLSGKNMWIESDRTHLDFDLSHQRAADHVSGMHLLFLSGLHCAERHPTRLATPGTVELEVLIALGFHPGSQRHGSSTHIFLMLGPAHVFPTVLVLECAGGLLELHFPRRCRGLGCRNCRGPKVCSQKDSLLGDETRGSCSTLAKNSSKPIGGGVLCKFVPRLKRGEDGVQAHRSKTCRMSSSLRP